MNCKFSNEAINSARENGVGRETKVLLLKLSLVFPEDFFSEPRVLNNFWGPLGEGSLVARVMRVLFVKGAGGVTRVLFVKGAGGVGSAAEV